MVFEKLSVAKNILHLSGRVSLLEASLIDATKFSTLTCGRKSATAKTYEHAKLSGV